MPNELVKLACMRACREANSKVKELDGTGGDSCAFLLNDEKSIACITGVNDCLAMILKSDDGLTAAFHIQPNGVIGGVHPRDISQYTWLKQFSGKTCQLLCYSKGAFYDFNEFCLNLRAMGIELSDDKIRKQNSGGVSFALAYDNSTDEVVCVSTYWASCYPTTEAFLSAHKTHRAFPNMSPQVETEKTRLQSNSLFSANGGVSGTQPAKGASQSYWFISRSAGSKIITIAQSVLSNPLPLAVRGV